MSVRNVAACLFGAVAVGAWQAPNAEVKECNQPYRYSGEDWFIGSSKLGNSTKEWVEPMSAHLDPITRLQILRWKETYYDDSEEGDEEASDELFVRASEAGVVEFIADGRRISLTLSQRDVWSGYLGRTDLPQDMAAHLQNATIVFTNAQGNRRKHKFPAGFKKAWRDVGSCEPPRDKS